MNDQGIGASVRRKEDFRFLTGAGNYTDDINRPGQLYAYILRSPHAHAEIAGIETSNANGATEPLSLSRAPILRRHRIEPMRISAMLAGVLGMRRTGAFTPAFSSMGRPRAKSLAARARRATASTSTTAASSTSMTALFWSCAVEAGGVHISGTPALRRPTR